MPRNEEGEFELVLGNKQLLSVFFIVVVLLGVFFVMGFILGKNSAPAATEVASARKSAESGPAPNPIYVEPNATKSSASGDIVVERTKPEAVPPVKTEPAKTEPVKPEPVKPEPQPAKPEPKVEAKKEAKKETKAEAKTEAKTEPKPEARPAAGEARNGEPPKGTLFMQVGAVARNEADTLAKVLKSKGYSIWIAPADANKPGIFRVLVGPIQRSELGKAKSELSGLGFNPFPRSY
jgi:cell division septation protein DedD